MFHKIIKELRERKKISQDVISKKINISRSNYIKFEKGKVDLNLSQALKLSNLFGISLDDLKNNLFPDYVKYKEMVLAFLRNVKSQDKKIPKTKLAKLLYLADFSWYYYNLKSMSGMKYRKIPFGPVPDTYFRVIDELEYEGKISIDRKGDMLLISENDNSKKRNLGNLSKDEIKLINKISYKWNDKKTNEIVEFTHNQLPYILCQSDEIIPYELIIQQDPNDVY
ncbi:MAG TPA: DUF4065 domain-containing protein [Candidatus Paceibacterota bacterium]|jgi:transcriptional regulator with XRE-family HTH domain|nr:DUF4065 domain-containing protein [Candidatus Paceibacterota bacterium]HRZ29820.1 DUF4065 domain-containing protein [Candidatus Paceibacterota bacterium]